MTNKGQAVIILISLLFPFFVFAEDQQLNDKSSELYDPVPTIMHHIADAHDWHLWEWKDNPVTIPLPVILHTSEGFDVFMSSEFNHGHATVQKENRIYSIDSHSHITEESGMDILDLSITKNVTSMLISVLLLLLILTTTSRSYKRKDKTPKGLQAFLEPLILFVRNDIIKDNISYLSSSLSSSILFIKSLIL